MTSARARTKRGTATRRRVARAALVVASAIAAAAPGAAWAAPPAPAAASASVDGKVLLVELTAAGAPPLTDRWTLAGGRLASRAFALPPGRYVARPSPTGPRGAVAITATLGGGAHAAAIAVRLAGRALSGTVTLDRAGQPRATLTVAGRVEALYDRLGGAPAIRAIVVDLLEAFARDPVITANPHTAAARMSGDRGQIREHFVAFVCRLAGGPEMYEGRSMVDSHAHLAISAAEWDAGMRDLAAILDRRHVARRERDELLALVATTRGDIVTR